MVESREATSNRLVLFVGGERGYQVLRAVLEQGQNVSAVLVQEQDAHEIDVRTQDIVELCRAHSVESVTTATVKPAEYAEYLATHKSDAVVVISWRFIIPETCFSIPTHGIYVIHDSLLPAYRGFAPTNWAIINGESESGVTLMHIAPGVDAGDIVDQRRVDIAPDDDANTLGARLTALYPVLVMDNLDRMLTGTCPRNPQDHSKATYCCKRTPDDGHIDFSMSAESIVRLVRGVTYPFPGAFSMYNGERIIVWEAEVDSAPPQYVGRIPGRVLGRARSGGIQVLAGEGVVVITKVARADAPEEFLKPEDVFRSVAGRLC